MWVRWIFESCYLNLASWFACAPLHYLALPFIAGATNYPEPSALRAYSHEMRHLKRQFGVSLAQLAEFFFDETKEDESTGRMGKLVRCATKDMRADGFTKSFKTVAERKRILHLLCLAERDPESTNI